MQEKVSAQYKNEIEMAKAQRDYELKKADYDMEVNTKKAESEMAYQLQVPPCVCSSSLIRAPFKLLIRDFSGGFYFLTSFIRWPKPSSASRRRRCRSR